MMKVEALDVLADAVDDAYSDPNVRTALDTARRLMDALTAAGFAVVRTEACPHCGADNAGNCRRPGACRWTN
jgi:hypothetical protein